MYKLSKIWLITVLVLTTELSQGQNASIVINNNTYLVSKNGAYIVLPGNLQTDGKVITDALSYWNFTGTLQQRITCKTASGCVEIFNVNSYNTVLGNVNQNNTNGITIEINTKVAGTHFFNAGATEIKEGNYWLTNTTTPFSNNNNINQFFVTKGHGLLKQSSINNAGTFFPVGSAANQDNYTPVTLSADATDNYAVRVYDNVYYAYDTKNGDFVGYQYPEAVNYRFVKKTWIINKETPVTYPFAKGFTVTPQWNLINEDPSFTAIKFQKSSVVRNHDTLWLPQNWLEPVTQLSPTVFTKTNFITYDNAFYPYYPISVSAINQVLPVTGLVLSGKLADNNVWLDWFTLTEINTDHFEIERSEDGRNFASIGKVAAFGSSTIKRFYDFTDTKITGTIYYYRIKEVDKDGKYIYSNTIAIQISGVYKGLKIYPNPVFDHFYVEFSHLPGDYTIQLLNNYGEVLQQKEASIGEGVEKVRISNFNYASGPYYLRILNKTTFQSKNIQLLIIK